MLNKKTISLSILALSLDVGAEMSNIRLRCAVLYLTLFEFFILQSFANGHAAHHLPKLLLISLDGFKWTYLSEHTFKNLNYLSETGTHVDYVENVFPTVTFT